MPLEEMTRTRPNYFFETNHMTTLLREPDHAITELVAQKESCNPYGRVHGGAFYTLGDTAAAYAIHTDGRLYVTQHGNVNFIRNVTIGGTVRAEACIRHRGRSTCLCEVTFTDETDTLLATGEFTFFCINQTPQSPA